MKIEQVANNQVGQAATRLWAGSLKEAKEAKGARIMMMNVNGEWRISPVSESQPVGYAWPAYISSSGLFSFFLSLSCSDRFLRSLASLPSPR